jgi:hypothetical protein
MGRRAAAIYSMVQTCRLNEIRDNRSVRALGAFPSGSCNARAVGGLSNGRLPYTNPFLVALIPGPAHGLTPSTREGSATRACGLFGFACAVIAAPGPDTSGACRAGMVPASKTGAGPMSQALSIAHARGWNLAITLMICITCFTRQRRIRHHAVGRI